VQPLLPWKSNQYYIFWVCVCSLRYQHATCCAMSSSTASSALQYFSTLSQKRQDFQNNLLDKICVFWSCLQVLSETFLIPEGT